MTSRIFSKLSVAISGVGMALGLSACAPTPVETASHASQLAVVQPEVVEQPAVIAEPKLEPQAPQIDRAKWVSLSRTAFAQGAVTTWPYQSALMAPSPDVVRYLMRAARYQAAAEAVKNIEEPDASMQFVGI